jgi:Mg-chelatase subunit ChlD
MPRFLPAALALVATTLLACSHGALHASDAHWPSPPTLPERGGIIKPRPPHPMPGSGPWPGMIWSGVDSGAPPAPTARHCRRPPQPFEVGAGGHWDDMPQHTSGRRDELMMARKGVAGAGAVAALESSPAAMSAPPPAPVAAAPAPLSLPAPSRERRTAADAAESVAPQSMPRQLPRPADEPVAAGVVDDNADFGEYLAYRQRTTHLAQRVRSRDVTERYQLVVQDERGRAVPDAQVTVTADGRSTPLWARTDAHGRVWLHPSAVNASSRFMEVQVIDGASGSRGSAVLQRGQKDRLQIVLRGTEPSKPQLDIAFLIDATGSMADEIDKLKRSMRAVADDIARLPSAPDVCYALVAYRDRGDAFFVRGADFTNDLGAFQSQLAQLQAGGGGDKPEALNEALHTAVHRLSWRGDGTARMVLLVADAAPHLDYGTPPNAPQYDQDAIAAVAKGIKLFAVGASGLEPEGEYIYRQAAQYTGGRFVFLTYAQAHNPSSGPGRETVHDVKNYSVETLDKLIVRLVREEMAGRG